MTFLVEFFKSILDFLNQITNNLGISIIFLSVINTLLMSPIFWIVNLLQKIEKGRIEIMQPLLNEIKDLNNKQEKYYYTKEIYRRYNYRSYYAFANTLGVLIQMPFFLAVYWMLKDYPLENIPFGPINSLSRPDGILNLEGLKINILPLIMFLINILVSLISQEFKKERLQNLLISLVFLIVLYNTSSALILYWIITIILSSVKRSFLSRIKSYKLETYTKNQILRIKYNKQLFYLILFSIVPVLSFYYSNIAEVKIYRTYNLLFLSVFLTIILFYLSKFIFKNKIKAIFFCFTTLVFFFSFGHLREFFLNYSHDKFSYYFYILGHLILFFSLYLLIIFSKKPSQKLIQFLNTLTISIVFVLVVRILLFEVNNQNTFKTKIFSESNYIYENNLSKNLNEFPDIYYIVLDAYANSSVLKEVFNYDNSDFEGYLEKKGFFVAKNSRSNYMMTFLSLASILNMDYINFLRDELGVSSINKVIPLEMINNSKVLGYLKDKGYNTINIKSGWGITNLLDKYNLNLPENKYIDDFTITFFQTTIFRILYNRIDSDIRNTVLGQFKIISDFNETKVPKFIFSHIVSPHPPYVFDSNGQKVNSDIKLNNDFNQDKIKYIEQLKFITKKTKELVDVILNKSKKSIIVIQSDHGSSILSRNDWRDPSTEFIVERSKTLNAILLNGFNSDQLYSDISSVNTFRVIFNSVFKENYKLLEDSTYFSAPKRPYDFKNVTDIIK